MDRDRLAQEATVESVRTSVGQYGQPAAEEPHAHGPAERKHAGRGRAGARPRSLMTSVRAWSNAEREPPKSGQADRVDMTAVRRNVLTDGAARQQYIDGVLEPTRRAGCL
jgi:hypothetical protein